MYSDLSSLRCVFSPECFCQWFKHDAALDEVVKVNSHFVYSIEFLYYKMTKIHGSVGKE